MVRSRIQIDFRRCRRNSATSRIKMMPRCSSDPACAPERSPQWRGQMPDHVADSGLDLNDRKKPQSAFITNDGIGQDHFHDHPIDWLRALMAAMNVPLSSTEPDLQVPTTALSSVGEKFAPFARPWIAIGIGASHPDKDWPDATWCEFLLALRTPGTVFLVGGPAHNARTENLYSRPVQVRSLMPATCA